jgi:LPS O-antigen subunit length determinant protein (WzzB/FepE family)
MKKNNSYLVNDETRLADLIKSLLKEKVLILSISIICGLVAYLYASFQPRELKTEIKKYFLKHKGKFSTFKCEQ